MNNVTVWSKDACSYCEMSKNLLQSKGILFEEKKIGYDGISRDDLLKVLPSARSVPQIFIDGNHIGGFQELKKLLDENV